MHSPRRKLATFRHVASVPKLFIPLPIQGPIQDAYEKSDRNRNSGITNRFGKSMSPTFQVDAGQMSYVLVESDVLLCLKAR